MTEEYGVFALVTSEMHHCMQDNPKPLRALELSAFSSLSRAISNAGRKIIGTPSRQERYYPKGQCITCLYACGECDESERESMIEGATSPHWHYFWTVDAEE